MTDSSAADQSMTGRGVLISFRGLLLALAGTLLLSWPLLVTNSIFVFSDTASYIRGGEVALASVERLFAAPPPMVSDSGAEAQTTPLDTSNGPKFIRSLIYSAMSYLAVVLAGPLLLVLAQGSIVVFMFLALVRTVPALSYTIVGLGSAWMLAASQLPWFTVYMMPDIFGAALLIYGAILMRLFDELSFWKCVVLGLGAAIAISAHYGNPPVALALFAAVLLWRAIRRRLTRKVVLGALLPLLFTPLTNISVSSVALEETSVSPLRLPVLLARVMDDGPGRWYLEEACPEADLAFCRAFGDRKFEGMDAFLWEADGIRSLTQEQMREIRQEELLVVWLSVRAYPLHQIGALLRNIGLTLTLTKNIGLYPVQGFDDNFNPVGQGEDRVAVALLRAYNQAFPWLTVIGALPLIWLMATRRLAYDQTEIAFAILLGILVNAMVFGGLSAAADRYNSRLIWLLPALSALFLAEHAGRPRPRQGQ